MRAKGVSVFPGYRDAHWRETAAAFDEEGYYRIGDAGFVVDAEQRPERGVIFNGRVAEDFRASSGTWVSVGTLRVELVSRLAPCGAGSSSSQATTATSWACWWINATPAGAAAPKPGTAALRRVMHEQRARRRRGQLAKPRLARLVLADPPVTQRPRDHRQGLRRQPTRGA